MDVTAREMVQQVLVLLRQGLGLSLDKEDPLVLERTGPVGVDLELTSDVLGDDQLLRII